MARILVVDDEPLTRDLLQMHLERCGHDVLTAENAVHAVHALHDHDFDLVLSDVDMPAMDGLQLLEHIRTDEITSHLPVILLTARTDQATAARAARLGANRYLCKPVMVDQLVAAIDAALVEAPAETPRVLVLRPRFA